MMTIIIYSKFKETSCAGSNMEEPAVGRPTTGNNLIDTWYKVSAFPQL